MSTYTDNQTDVRPTGSKILIVDDDVVVSGRLAEALRFDGHAVAVAESADEAGRRLRCGDVELLLLDVNLPDRSGYDVLRELRGGKIGDGAASNLPVMMISGLAGEIDRIRGFEFGCDDYVTKPYSLGELRGRVAAIMRRSTAVPVADVLEFGDLRIDRRGRHVFVNGNEVALTVKEYALLCALAEDPMRVFTRGELLQSVWGFRAEGSTRTLDAHACRLRAKLGGGRDQYIVNVWGVGYRLTEHEERR